MKIVFLTVAVLCVYALSASTTASAQSYHNKRFENTQLDIASRGLITDSLKDILEMVISEVKKIVQGLLGKIEDFIKSAQENINSLVEIAQKQVEVIFKRILERLGNLAGENAKTCVQQQMPILQGIYNTTRDELLDCAIEAGFNVAESVEDARTYIQFILNETEIVRNAVQDCLESSGGVISIAKCITSKTNEFREEIFEVIRKTKSAIIDATKKSVTIVAGSQLCIAKAVAKANKDGLDLFDTVSKCIASGEKPEVLVPDEPETPQESEKTDKPTEEPQLTEEPGKTVEPEKPNEPEESMTTSEPQQPEQTKEPEQTQQSSEQPKQPEEPKQ